ncbi:MAG: 30S ribosomal protein S12 methylthiotransferase RimO [FCB group bacterium]|nr:30S ribosomal protein S12 methylthiotransferase RimO [FCB group bacterium]
MSESERPTVNIISLGCAKNLVDSEILLGGLRKSTVEVVDDPEKAETIVVNTCGFLDQAREESIDVILQAAELKKHGRLKQLVVMGCLSERYRAALQRELPEVDRFFGTNDHRQVVSFLTGKPHAKDDPLFFRSLLTPGHYAYLKIAEGCDNGCSFCSIPIMRGLQKSRTIPDILSEAKRLVEGGVKELLVIAQDSTSYGWDLTDKVYLSDLIKELDTIDDDLRWIRIHYAHPAHLSQRIIDAMATAAKVCRYLDIPVQHASDRILMSMRRGLGREGIRDRIQRLREAIPEIRLRTSIIVGYPGETEDDFKMLCDFLREIEFDRLGVFTYSEEEGTPAANLPDNVPRALKDERKAVVMDLQNEISAEKNARLVGREMVVVVDEVKDGVALGRTEFDSPEVDNLVRISGIVQPGSFVNVLITESDAYELKGVTVQ